MVDENEATTEKLTATKKSLGTRRPPEMEGKALYFNAYSRIQEPFTLDSRNLILIYYLCDDTIQINQIIEPNSGYDGSSVYLRRMRIPKNWSVNMNLPGNETKMNILNVLGDNFLKGRFVADKQASFVNKTEYIKVNVRQKLILFH